MVTGARRIAEKSTHADEFSFTFFLPKNTFDIFFSKKFERRENSYIFDSQFSTISISHPFTAHRITSVQSEMNLRVIVRKDETFLFCHAATGMSACVFLYLNKIVRLLEKKSYDGRKIQVKVFKFVSSIDKKANVVQL